MSRINPYIPGTRAAVGHGLPGRPVRSDPQANLQGLSFTPAPLGQYGKVYSGGVYAREQFPLIAAKFAPYEPGQLMSVPAVLSGSHAASVARGGSFRPKSFNPSRTRVAGLTSGASSNLTYSRNGVFVWLVGTNTFGEYQIESSSSVNYEVSVLGWASDDVVLVERVTFNSAWATSARDLLVFNVASGAMVLIGSAIAGTLGDSFLLIHLDATHAYTVSGSVYVKTARSNGASTTSAGIAPMWGANNGPSKMWPSDGDDPHRGGMKVLSNQIGSNRFRLHTITVTAGVVGIVSRDVLNIQGNDTSVHVPLLGATAVRRAGVAYCFYADGSYEIKPSWLSFPEAFWLGIHPYPALRVCMYSGQVYRYDLESASMSVGIPMPQASDALYPFAPGFAPKDITTDIGPKGVKTSAFVPSGSTANKALWLYNADTNFCAMPEPGVMEVLP